MFTHLKTLCLCVVMGLGYVVFAQEPYSVVLDKTFGMPSNEVYDLFQDKYGFVWLGTSQGLSSFDGKRFKTYFCKEQTSVAGSCVRSDKFGNIWYENFDGYVYYVQKGEMKALEQNPPITFIPFGLTSKYLFVFQKKGVDVYLTKDKKRVKTIEFDAFGTEGAISVGEDFYYAVNSVIFRVDSNLNVSETSILENSGNGNLLLSEHNNRIYAISKLNKLQTIYVFDKQLNFICTYKLSNNEVIRGLESLNGLLWVHSINGTKAYEVTETGLSKRHDYFSGKSISKVMRDYQGNYWFATTSEGVFVANNLENSFYGFRNFVPKKLVLKDSTFLIGSKNGEIFEKAFGESNAQLRFKNTTGSEIYYLYYDSINQNTFFSSSGFDFVQKGDYSKTNNKSTALKSVCRIDHKYYAIAVSGFVGIMKWNNNLEPSVWDEFFEKNKNTEEPTYASIASRVRGKSIVYDSTSQRLYYATNEGLFQVSPTNAKEIKYDNNSFYAEDIEVYEKNIFVRNTKGNLFVIKPNHEFELLNKKLQIKEYDIKNLKQFNGLLLFFSSNNLHQLNLKTNKHSVVEISVNPNDIVDYAANHNSLFLMKSNGIITTKLQVETPKKTQIKFVINEVLVSNESMNFEKKILLNYDQSDLTVNYSILDFGSSIPNQLYYKINDKNWMPVSNTENSLQFPSLEPGAYEVHFKLNEQTIEQKISFEISPPFWNTYWFLFLTLSSLGVLFLVVYQYRIRKISAEYKIKQERMKLEKELSQSLLTSIKAQMNPHFFYNALNTIQSYIFSNDKRNASNYLSKFSKLTRMILEMSENENIKLNEEIESLTLYLELEKMRFEDDFNFEIKVLENVDVEMIKIPSMLIQPYVENAVKHGLLHKEGDKNVSIEFGLAGNNLQVKIKDNGIGRVKSEELNKIKANNHASYATKANLKRLELLNKGNNYQNPIEFVDLYDNNKQAIGTEVILYITIS